ncbi:MAG: cytochrome c [Anaerolineales bacterium]|nr:cytochrome c [Anaerolineales bacterium]MCB9128478.1 cytochrome c [Ardenticatenales bacterium]MCB9172682.1 cytochrome c [Ardenticatenales bacterium]
MKRNYLALALSLILLLALSACGSSDSNEVGTETTSGQEMSSTTESDSTMVDEATPEDSTDEAATDDGTTEEAATDEGAEAMAGDAAAGETIFNQTCVACHGAGGVGVQGLGKAFQNNEFVSGQSDEELVAFLHEGRAADDPANSSGVAMPAKGGNASLTDQDLYNVVAYIRTIQ